MFFQSFSFSFDYTIERKKNQSHQPVDKNLVVTIEAKQRKTRKREKR